MEISIKKWGNSAALRIPAFILQAARLNIDQLVDVREEDGRIIIEPISDETQNLQTLVDAITPENLHTETDTGTPVGKEVW